MNVKIDRGIDGRYSFLTRQKIKMTTVHRRTISNEINSSLV